MVSRSALHLPGSRTAAMAAVHVKVPPGSGPALVVIGVVLVLLGLSTIAWPASFRMKPLWNVNRPLPTLSMSQKV